MSFPFAYIDWTNAKVDYASSCYKDYTNRGLSNKDWTIRVEYALPNLVGKIGLIVDLSPPPHSGALGGVDQK